MNTIVDSEPKSEQSDDQERLNSANDKPEKKQPAGMSLAAYLRVLAVGIFLGIVFVKSEVATWDRIHKMFLFQEAHMYLIITAGIVVSGICMWLIKKYGIKTVEGKPIRYEPKPFNNGVVLGGMLFGAGWAITGACPGPIYAQIGGGELMSLITLGGALLGMYCFALLKPKLP